MTEGQWQFYFDAPKGKRILRSRFIGITHFSMELWWSYEHKKWLPMDECGVQGASSTAPCRSFKAFKSHLRRHPELQTGATITLASWFGGHDIHARWSKELKARPLGRFVIDDQNRYLSRLVGSAGL
jgi:hypothetical protein